MIVYDTSGSLVDQSQILSPYMRTDSPPYYFPSSFTVFFLSSVLWSGTIRQLLPPTCTFFVTRFLWYILIHELTCSKFQQKNKNPYLSSSRLKQSVFLLIRDVERTHRILKGPPNVCITILRFWSQTMENYN